MKSTRSLLAVLFGAVLGCTQASSPVAPPRLTTHLAQPSALTALHKVQLGAWHVSPDLRGLDGQLPALNQLLRQSADSELGFDVAWQGEAGAKDLRVDGTMTAELIEFQERQGSALASDRPARVGFKLSLLSPKGMEIWHASYHLDDAALSDNLFRIKESLKRGPRWRTADEILTVGLQDAFRDLEALRTAQFTGGQAR